MTSSTKKAGRPKSKSHKNHIDEMSNFVSKFLIEFIPHCMATVYYKFEFTLNKSKVVEGAVFPKSKNSTAEIFH